MIIREFSNYESISSYAMDAMTWVVNYFKKNPLFSIIISKDRKHIFVLLKIEMEK